MLNNQGTVHVQNALTAGDIRNSGGHVRVEGGTLTSTRPIINDADGHLYGRGTINADVINSGTSSLYASGTGSVALYVTGNVMNAPGCSVWVDTSDTLTIAGTLRNDGLLQAAPNATVNINAGFVEETVTFNGNTDEIPTNKGVVEVASGATINLPNDERGVLLNTGTIQINGGTMNCVGMYNDGNATLTGGLLNNNAGVFAVGVLGTGTFTQSGGTNSVIRTNPNLSGHGMMVGGLPGSSGTYTLAGGQLLVEKGLYVGGDDTALGGTGQITVSGSATLDVQAVLKVWANGTVNFDGGTLSAVTVENSGRIVHAAGTNTIDQDLYVGRNSGSSGTYELSGTGQLSARYEYVGYSGTGTFTQTGGTNTVSNILYLGYDSGSSGTYELSGTGQLSANFENIGYNGTGRFTQTGGTNTVSYYLNLGIYSGSSDTYELSGTGQLSALVEFVGLYDMGTFMQTGGTNTVNSLYLGRNSGSSGTYELSGTGQLSAYREDVGNSGTGTFTQTGGTNTVSSYLYVGTAPGSSGTYELSGTGQLSGNYEYVGYSGTGTFTQTGGTNTVSSYLYVGRNSGSSGTYELSGTGQLSANYYEYVGYNGTGTFKQTGGTNTVSISLYLGYNSSSSGTYELSGTGQLSASHEYVGNSGTGTFTQTGGTNTISSSLYLGRNSGSSGMYELSGTGQLSANSEYVGNSGTGRFMQTGGTNTVNNDLYLGRNSGSSGTYELGGSGQLSANYEYVGYHATGRFTQTGGTNTIARTLRLGYDSGSSGTYELGGGMCDAGYLSINEDSTYTFSGGTLAVREGLRIYGLLDLAQSSVTLEAEAGIINFAKGTIANAGSASLLVGADDALVIFPEGSGPQGGFGSVISNGIVHVAGSQLIVPAGKGFAGYGEIVDHVYCEGWIAATHPWDDWSRDIKFLDGLTLAGGAVVDLRSLEIDNGTTVSIEASGGQLSAADLIHVGSSSDMGGNFSQEGGMVNTVHLVLGQYGTYTLSGTGELITNVTLLSAGGEGTVTFNQTGGTHFVTTSGSPRPDDPLNGTLVLIGPVPSYSNATYNLSGGDLSAETTVVYVGTFTQTGGAHTAGDLQIGFFEQEDGFYIPGDGAYTISAGSLEIEDLRIGLSGPGRLEISDPGCDITVSNQLVIGADGSIIAVPGSTIHMTGSAFENQSTDPDALLGLADLTLIFEGGSGIVDLFEVAGENMLAELDAFESNFALGTLQLGGTAGIGQLQLVDLFDNRPDWDGNEVLYVENLILGTGSYLDLNGFDLFYQGFTNLGGTIDLNGGSMFLVFEVPEPSTLWLIALGGLCLICYVGPRQKGKRG